MTAARNGVVIALVACFLGSCQTKEAAEELLPDTVAQRDRGSKAPQIRSLDASVGRIESVRRELGFVVLDYSLSTMPPIGATLIVERAGAEVGRLRLTGPTRSGTGKTVAEIVLGQPGVGDSVRAQ